MNIMQSPKPGFLSKENPKIDFVFFKLNERLNRPLIR